MGPPANTIVLDLAHIASRDRLQVNTAYMRTNSDKKMTSAVFVFLPSVQTGLTVGGHLDV